MKQVCLQILSNYKIFIKIDYFQWDIYYIIMDKNNFTTK